MPERYDSIRNFEEKLHERAAELLSNELALFEEMAELMLEPLDIVAPQWQDREEKAPQLMLIARLFNDFEAGKLLLLHGLTEQAFMAKRDTIECMLLLRLFDADAERGLRWVKNLAQYSPGKVNADLRELGIEAPEYALYGTFSQLSHTNLLASVNRATETELEAGTLLRQYHFGGYFNKRSLTEGFHMLLILEILALTTVLSGVYYAFMSSEEHQEWFLRVQKVLPRLKELGLSIQMEEPDSPEPPETQRDQDLRRLVQRRLKINFEISYGERPE